MSIRQLSIALETLKEYPALTEYIKSFDGNDGFMYTVETTDERKELQRKMEKLLDDGSHSGASWGWLMRTVQGVLNGVFTLEELKKQEETLN